MSHEIDRPSDFEGIRGQMVFVLDINACFQLIREPLVISQMSPFEHLFHNPAGLENLEHIHARDQVVKLVVHCCLPVLFRSVSKVSRSSSPFLRKKRTFRAYPLQAFDHIPESAASARGWAESMTLTFRQTFECTIFPSFVLAFFNCNARPGAC